MWIEPLITYFNAYIPLKRQEKLVLASLFSGRKIRRRQFVLQENDHCHHYTFVVSGCLKMYGTDPNGIEHNLQFATQNDWITDIGSFHSMKKSQLAIEAVEASVILQIEKQQLIHLYHNYPKFDRIFRVITENKLVEFQNRILQTISSTAEERYQSFLAQYPMLASRLPNTQIASYLGITPESLSRLRRRLAKK